MTWWIVSSDEAVFLFFILYLSINFTMMRQSVCHIFLSKIGDSFIMSVLRVAWQKTFVNEIHLKDPGANEISIHWATSDISQRSFSSAISWPLHGI